MKRICNLSTFTFLTISLMFILITSCKTEDPNKPKLLPELTTSEITQIAQNTATCGGNITSDNGLEVTARGVCWSLQPNPTIKDSLTIDAAGTGLFTSSIKKLLADTTYYVRAYATNSDGTAYGLQLTFRTLKSLLPTLITTNLSNITQTSATCGGNITLDGGSPIISRGVCWSLEENPTIENEKTSNGTGLGVFTSNISNLQTGLTYYVRAYATNIAGTNYGNQIILKTLSIPKVVTKKLSSVTASSVISGGTIMYDGGVPIIKYGLCWSTNSNPTIVNNNTSNNNDVGAFTNSITGLNTGTKYFLRAYATNSIGTAYGNEISFTTNGTFTDIDGNLYHFITIGSQIWMLENLKTTKYNDGSTIPLVTDNSTWKDLTSGACCWYNNDINNKNTYGALYNLHAVKTGKLSPIGWHVPTKAEWDTLKVYLSYSSFGGKLKETGTVHWIKPNSDATNTSGFTALPGGYRDGDWYGNFSNIGLTGAWWQINNSTSYIYGNYIDNKGDINGDSYHETSCGVRDGLSVRCIKDN